MNHAVWEVEEQIWWAFDYLRITFFSSSYKNMLWVFGKAILMNTLSKCFNGKIIQYGKLSLNYHQTTVSVSLRSCTYTINRIKI